MQDTCSHQHDYSYKGKYMITLTRASTCKSMPFPFMKTTPSKQHHKLDSFLCAPSHCRTKKQHLLPRKFSFRSSHPERTGIGSSGSGCWDKAVENGPGEAQATTTRQSTLNRGVFQQANMRARGNEKAALLEHNTPTVDRYHR
jgi:hypothetical protein